MISAFRKRAGNLLHPVTLTFLALLLYLGAALIAVGGDPLAAARIPPNAATWSPDWYDGQFTYFIARDPNPATVASFLDVPAYRYQRILLPLLARALSFGNTAALPWALWLIGVTAHLWGTAMVARLLEGYGVSRCYALIYGLWVGFLLAARLDLPDALACALIGAGILYGETRPRANAASTGSAGGASPVRWGLFALAVFAKEVVILFVAAQIVVDLAHKNWRNVLGLALIAVFPFLLFQGWLLIQFGAIGLGSGGALATGFELVPFMGLLRIGAYSQTMLLAYAVMWGPFFYLPAVWGVWAGVKRWLAGERNVVVAALVLNALIIPFLPFSTVREPTGMFRFACGLVLAFVLFAARYRLKRPLNYAFLWLILLAVLLNG